MKKIEGVYIAIFLTLLIGKLPVMAGAGAGNPITLNSSNTSLVWKVKADADVMDKAAIHHVGFVTGDWVKGIVPGTVFGSYVAAGLESDPNYGDNIYNVDKSKYDRNFWYRTEFKIPSDYTSGTIWLNFEGVNRKADIYLNGNFLGKLEGFMQRGIFDITAIASRTSANVLAILVYVVGSPPLQDGASPTYLSSAGWDWMPYVPGKLMGITDDVYLSNSGNVSLIDPWVRSDLPSLTTANLSISMTLKNNTSEPQSGVLTGTINPGNIQFTQIMNLNPSETRNIVLDKTTISQLTIQDPALWWPNGYGPPNLYSCELNYSINGTVSDTRKVNFGIRKYTYDTDGNVLHISVNGTRIFLKGGNWGMSEYMLRCRGAEYETKLRFHKEMNFNMIRNWTGSTTDEEFYDACDKYGMMVWDDFWFAFSYFWPGSTSETNSNAIEKVKRLRNHPCIAIWCGANETDPPSDFNSILYSAVSTYDGNDRYYQKNSHAGNLTGSGPWGIASPQTYFTGYPGNGGNAGWGLRSEIGTAVFTTYESFKKFIPQANWWPRNDMWDRHFFGPSASGASPDSYESNLNSRYGTATGIEDFCKKAQFLNIETNKAMYEGWLDHLWNDASGILIWMSQSAYPSLVWQTYDYYYDLTGAYWGVKKACEPIHIQWNCANDSVKVVNTSSEDLTSVTAEAHIFNKDGNEAVGLDKSSKISVLKNTSQYCFRLSFDNNNLAYQQSAYASSSSLGTPGSATDGNGSSRWSSNYTDNEWIYVDLGAEKSVGAVVLSWEAAYGKSYKIQVSDNAATWTDVFLQVQETGVRIP